MGGLVDKEDDYTRCNGWPCGYTEFSGVYNGFGYIGMASTLFSMVTIIVHLIGGSYYAACRRGWDPELR